MLRVIRTCFNITNISLANYTGASYDTLKSLSSNRRSYNNAIFNKLLTIYKALALQTPIATLPHALNFIKNEEELALPKLVQLLKKAEKKLQRKHASLQLLQEKRANWLHGIHACLELLQKEDLTSNDAKWINLRKKHLEIQLTDNSLFKIVALQTTISALNTEIASLHNFIKEFNNSTS
ncbi:hypothetical protein [Tenacibaculum ovolyticum]|uniref:hypothetical protein n=1 Tax=Tenacibaculum ovolyticum TaxID=104270 RepID=UPI001F303BFD|nr:hypothetical protein [Tenacibaculum ovolyticum]